jgi:hypothetical protein
VPGTAFKRFFHVMLWRHYHRAVTQKQAAAFWKIEPPTRSKSKIIAMVTA